MKKSYNNIKYTSFTPDATQIWSGADILLSATAGKAYAYYPYADGTAITAIALNVANNDDVLYDASGVTVTNASPMATFQLNHALSLVTVDIVRNTYTGTGSVSAFSLKAKKASALIILVLSWVRVTCDYGYDFRVWRLQCLYRRSFAYYSGYDSISRHEKNYPSDDDCAWWL